MTFCADDPTVTLGGVVYSVPPISFRHASKIVPKVLMRPNVDTEEGLLSIADIIYAGLKASHSELDYDTFMDGHYELYEMLTAVSVISRQAGLKEKPPGEATGEKIPL